ncbi:hypothetical protein AK812_SmicGene16838 [Symbiodinium microadriaticum]|uniref:Uncharacterized protein n=1 Tax=Symbiodinium microadriaticum TaxID=2951 RepID=A0A1Q9DZD7_SYMMI|nr:hypothetical protein AK812_SmicGene16838 [Symbiodinium microadriaticum]
MISWTFCWPWSRVASEDKPAPGKPPPLAAQGRLELLKAKASFATIGSRLVNFRQFVGKGKFAREYDQLPVEFFLDEDVPGPMSEALACEKALPELSPSVRPTSFRRKALAKSAGNHQQQPIGIQNRESAMKRPLSPAKRPSKEAALTLKGPCRDLELRDITGETFVLSDAFTLDFAPLRSDLEDALRQSRDLELRDITGETFVLSERALEALGKVKHELQHGSGAVLLRFGADWIHQLGEEDCRRCFFGLCAHLGRAVAQSTDLGELCARVENARSLEVLAATHTKRRGYRNAKADVWV